MDNSKNSEVYTFGKLENNENSDSEESFHDCTDENSVSEKRADGISSKTDENQQRLVKEMERLTSTDSSISSYLSSAGSSDGYKKSNYNDRGTTRDDYTKLPSEITDKEYIYMPPTSEEIDEEEDEDISGKWMIFLKGDLEKLDQYWLALIPLYKNGVLTRIKCSTAMGSAPGVINCYTANSENPADVKSAADAIRECVDYDTIMYYKTNEASALGLYNQFGCRNISKYMHTVSNCLYIREKFERWKLVSV